MSSWERWRLPNAQAAQPALQDPTAVTLEHQGWKGCRSAVKPSLHAAVAQHLQLVP